MARILLVGGATEDRHRLHFLLTGRRHDVFEAEAADDALERARNEQPEAIVLDSLPGGEAGTATGFLRALRLQPETAATPVLYIADRAEVARLDEALGAGADEVLLRPVRTQVFLAKLTSLLQSGGEKTEAEGGVPAILADAFARIAQRGRLLGDVAEVTGGIATGDNRKRLSEAPRGPEWRPILMEGDVERFRAGEESMQVWYQPRRLHFSPPVALLEAEKLLVRRDAPPYVAAVDRTGRLFESGLYGIVPAEGLSCEYLAAVFNSRFMDFFLRRIRPLPESPGMPSMLRAIDLEDIPVLLPSASEQAAVAKLVRQLEHAQSRGEAARLLAALHRGLFELHGFGRAEIDRLGQLHF